MAVPLNDVALAAPSTGETNVGEVALTGEPEPVAAVQTGAVAAPPPTKISVVAPAATTSMAAVTFPTNKPPSASVATPVPPFATLRVPVEEEKAASATGSVVPSPIIISPSAKTAIGVIAPVPEPKRTPPSVKDEAPVPPSATTRSVMPVTVP